MKLVAIAAVFSSFLAGGALAAPRDPLVVPGIGPGSSSAAFRYPRYSARRTHPLARRHFRFWIAENGPRAAPTAGFTPLRFGGAILEAPRLYDDDYRPAAYTAADAYPPPARPWLRPAPLCRAFAGWQDVR
jgi:hypothetical protein